MAWGGVGEIGRVGIVGRVGIACGVVVFGVSSCAHRVSQAPTDSGLVIVEHAKDVRYTSQHDGAVEYWNEDAYPASVTVKRLDQLLADAEWRPTDDDILSHEPNPDLRKWGSYYEPSGERVHQWLCTWKNEKGNFVTYVLRYRVAPGKPIPARLEVTGVIRQPSESSECVKLWKKSHN